MGRVPEENLGHVIGPRGGPEPSGSDPTETRVLGKHDTIFFRFSDRIRARDNRYIITYIGYFGVGSSSFGGGVFLELVC